MKTKNKKAVMSENMVKYAIAAVLIIIFLLILIAVVRNFRLRQRELLIKQLKEDITEAISTIDYGEVKDTRLNPPSNVNEICFFDLSRRDDILKSPLINRFPIIRNSLETGIRKNMFLIAGTEVIESFYAGDICFDHYPYFLCLPVTQGILDIYLEGKGRCALIISDFIDCEVITDNPTIQDITLVTNDAILEIPAGTQINFPGGETEICIEPVTPPPPLDTDPDGLITEVYSLTPENTGFTNDIFLTMKYYSELLPPNANINNIKMKYYDLGDWFKLTNPVIDNTKKTVKQSITTLKKHAAFGPEPPTSVIKVIEQEGPPILYYNEPYVFDISAGIKFDASTSYDNDGDISSYEWDFGGDGTLLDGTTTNDEKPKYQYKEIGSYTVTLDVTDSEGNKGTTTADISLINTNNKKDIPKYTGAFFLISKSDDWQNILQLIPLTMWTSQNGRIEKPYVVYDGTLSEAELKKIMNEYSATTAVFYDNIPAALSGLGYVTAISPNDYFSYWSQFQDVVLVDYDNKNAALMSALFASFLNTPIIFADGNHPPIIDLTGKNIYTIGSIDPSLPITPAKTYDLTDISSAPKNPYNELYGEIIPSNAISTLPVGGGGGGCLANGESCSQDSDCCSGNCFVDEDGDYYAPISGSKKCYSLAPRIGNDCCDSDAGSYPGVVGYHTLPNNCGSWDWNCDNDVTTRLCDDIISATLSGTCPDTSCSNNAYEKLSWQCIRHDCGTTNTVKEARLWYYQDHYIGGVILQSQCNEDFSGISCPQSSGNIHSDSRITGCYEPHLHGYINLTLTTFTRTCECK